MVNALSHEKQSKLETFRAPENTSVDVQYVEIYVLKNYNEHKDFHI